MLYIGSHTSYLKDKQLLGVVEESLSYGSNIFMFYTGSNQSTLRFPVNKELTSTAHKLMKENGIDKDKCIVHAPFIINLANNSDPDKYNFYINFFKQELKRCDQLGIKSIVLHPGSAVSYTKEEALENIVEALNLVLEKEYNCKILLETMAGKGSECGSSLEEIEYLLKNVKGSIGVCLDTCHLNDAGYSMQDFDRFLNEFDQVIGLSSLMCVHLNDSKNVLGSHKDRHENIGFGTMGFEVMNFICHHEALKNVPKILETPYVGESKEDKNRIYPPYRFEIEMLKRQTFDSHLYENIVNYYKKDL